MTDYPIVDIACPACGWAFEYALPPAAGQVRCKNKGPCGQWHPLDDLRANGLLTDTGRTITRPDLRRWWRPAPRRQAPPPAPDPQAAALRLLQALQRRPQARKRHDPPHGGTS